MLRRTAQGEYLMSEITLKKERPKHLDLRVIKQPLPAIASILHRVSGAGPVSHAAVPDLSAAS
jgi:hypothetical protein